MVWTNLRCSQLVPQSCQLKLEGMSHLRRPGCYKHLERLWSCKNIIYRWDLHFDVSKTIWNL